MAKTFLIEINSMKKIIDDSFPIILNQEKEKYKKWILN